MSPEEKAKQVREIVAAQRQNRKVKSIHAIHAAAQRKTEDAQR